ncbi:hypothetical protein J3R82DRAFT_1526 [Butyriboletus roseoflavus]|nr:hypothetical protein J3R82DRAFT_1526 [Butyriboletus roseoflavus]
MGLAGRKQKQRIPVDPRNLSWADDASRFGHSYLSKFGWDASQGLGPSGDGMKAHLKVQQKLDMMGIGAQHQRDPDGLAWKQNKEFEMLLKKLNESVEQRKGTDGGDAEREGGREREAAMDNAFVRAQEEKDEGELGNDSSLTAKKRKQKDRDGPDPNERIKKKPKKEKLQKSSSDDSATSAIDPTSESPSAPHPESIPKPRPMAHRARVRAAKRIAGKPASAISEILGIAPYSSVSTSTSTPVLTPPSTSSPASPPSLSLDNLTTSTKSVADYFKEKFLARSSSSFPASSSSAPSGSATPGLGATGLGLGLSNDPPFGGDR